MKNVMFMIAALLFAVSARAQYDACLSHTEFKFVVLGSSTAAGSGVSVPDSAWVNRFRSYVQGVNPGNEVVNLAVGGYNTYKILPTGYATPAGRPDEDTQRNITAALDLSPDLIIVNLPSNDVALGFSMQEQLDNLDTVRAIAMASGVPIYICTTQPRNFSDTLKLQMQRDLKDSIWARYGPEVIDFWSTFGLADHSIDPQYDSGDGVHMNDAAHAILCQRVVDMDLLNLHYTPYQALDYCLTGVELIPSTLCGDSITPCRMEILNLGISPSQPAWVYATLENVYTGQLQTDSLLTTALSQCSADTLFFSFNTQEAGEYMLHGEVIMVGDTILTNNALEGMYSFLGRPIILTTGDTLCEQGNTLLSAIVTGSDTVYWYNDSVWNAQSIAYGASFQTPILSTSQTYYAEAIRGDLFYRGELMTTDQSNINWNGAMFNLIALEDLVMDSLEMKINTLGLQTVEMYYRLGSFHGYELDANAWIFQDSVSVTVTSSSDFTSVPVGGLSLNQGDTMAIYLQMANGTSALSYRSVATEQVRSDGQLQIQTGCGIAHNFSGLYHPRDWNGTVFYHYGDRPGGECSTGKVPVEVIVSQSELSLGSDTIIDILDTLVLSTPAGFVDPVWHDGATSAAWEAAGPALGTGVHFISLIATDSLGCPREDEIVVAIADLVGLQNAEMTAPIVYPNPVGTTLMWEGVDPGRIEVLSTDGRMIYQEEMPDGKLDVSWLQTGIYVVRLHRGESQWVYLLEKE